MAKMKNEISIRSSAAVMDGLDFHVRRLPQTRIQAQRRHGIADARPDCLALAILGKRLGISH